ncbi:MAG TPA: ABC transporter permease [Candidatus Mediterraneibacter stercoripullorum]|nr:ABC transporter permease [Candidatus Mediterraneibacter stercoripullorum]
MTSGKFFGKWIREAGRGHIAAALSWGLLMIYLAVTLTRLSLDPQYTFFGAGSSELLWISEGLGLALAFVEFFYLLQQRKQDFYYSLPVRKGTVFWSRYVHGILHYMIPLVIVMTVCGVYQSTVDQVFFSEAAGYTGKSILMYGAVFLIFYHAGLLSVAVSGSVVTAVLVCAGILLYGGTLSGNVLTVFSEHFFRTYYRIPLLEEMATVLDPMALAGRLTGWELYDQREILAFVPDVSYIAAAVLWILLSLCLLIYAQKKRKTERTGRAFALPAGERTAEILLAFLAGVWLGSYLTDLTGLTDSPSGIPAGAALSAAAGVCSAAVVHLVLEGTAGGCRKQAILRRKWQMSAVCAAVLLTILAFPAGASSFDRYFPEDETEQIGISIDGLGMDYEQYRDAVYETGSYTTDQQMKEYILADEGKRAVLAWLSSVVNDDSANVNDAVTNDAVANDATVNDAAVNDDDTGQQENGSGDGSYTIATVCYRLQDGSEKYRRYQVSREQFQAFSSVYDTVEYKEKAYPAITVGTMADARYTWEDGVTETDLKLTEDEKEALALAYREDVEAMSMEDLTKALPEGFVCVDSETGAGSARMPVYPFHEQTCGLLREYGVDIEKTIKDYEIRSVEMYEHYGSVGPNISGGVSKIICDTPEEIEKWSGRLFPERLDLQPLLYPLDHSGNISDIRAEVEDPRTNSVTRVDCCLLPE